MKLNSKRLKIRSLTTTATAQTDDDVLLVSDAGGSWTLTLPPAANCINKLLNIKKTNSSGNTVTVDGNGAETIDGAATFILKEQYEVVVLVSDGFNWHVLIFNQGTAMRTIRGTIAANGAITRGEGFTVTKGGSASYTINWTAAAFSAVPSTVMTGEADRAQIASLPQTQTCVVVTYNAVGAATDMAFHFIARGPR